MNITVSLFGQMITFAILVFVTMKYVWPPIMKAMHDRQKKIADGLMAAEEGQHKLVLAEKKASEHLKDAKHQASRLLDEAKQRGGQIVEEYKQKAALEAQQIIQQGQAEIEQERLSTRDIILKDVGSLSVQIAEKVIQTHVSATDHARLIDQLIQDLEKTDKTETGGVTG